MEIGRRLLAVLVDGQRLTVEPDQSARGLAGEIEPGIRRGFEIDVHVAGLSRADLDADFARDIANT